MSALKTAEGALLQLPARLVLGGVFVFAGFLKLGDVQQFAFAIKGFKVLPADTAGHLITTAAFTLPWIELIAGLALILGFWTRGAALVLVGQLAVFTGALLSVIFRDIHASCSCFGDFEWPCGGEISFCQVWRNSVLLLLAGYLTWRGGGRFALDALCGGSCGRGSGAKESARVDSGAEDA